MSLGEGERPHRTAMAAHLPQLLVASGATLAGAVAFSGKAIVAKLMYRHGADAFSVVGLRMAMALPLFVLMAWLTKVSLGSWHASEIAQD